MLKCDMTNRFRSKLADKILLESLVVAFLAKNVVIQWVASLLAVFLRAQQGAAVL